MPKYKIDDHKSGAFRSFVRGYQKDFPNVERDIQEAFSHISQDIRAKKGNRVQVNLLPAGWECHKFRQNSKDIQRGANYGWRIVVLLDRASQTIFPILLYPKPELSNADTETIKDAIRDLFRDLGICTNSGCGGTLVKTQTAAVSAPRGEMRMKCDRCGAVYTSWPES